ncbi:MAG: hypothetical protein KC609_12935 [Myxococcales bacterium]|nr:hypothetical protein [Myxococcales bacterium]
MRSVRFIVVLVLVGLGPASVFANAPAPWWACDGKQVGEKCGDGTYYDGYCVLAPSCTDDTNTAVNECLQCTGSAPPADTVTPQEDSVTPQVDVPPVDTSYEDGVAPSGDTTTDTVGPDTTSPTNDSVGADTSTTPKTTSSSGGCSMAQTTTSLGLILLLMLLAIELQRRKHRAL